MKRAVILILLTFVVSSCDTWGQPPQPFPVWTPIPTITPQIFTATPFIIPPPTFESIQTPTPSITVITQVSPTDTEPPPPTPTFTLIPPTETFTQSPIQAVEVDILGCNTGIDIFHGMGEVTNAYVKIKNAGTVNLPNMCGLLRAIDEGREHPDKKVCIANLPVKNQVTLKLTVDSTYRADTIIQVDVTSENAILLRVDKQSCKDISLLGGVPTDVGVVEPLEE